jgi:predicted nucleic acid-binding protein
MEKSNDAFSQQLFYKDANSMQKHVRTRQKIDLMFDTNIFNAIVDGNISISEFEDYSCLYVTHVQEDEIRRTKNEERRNSLLAVIHQVSGMQPQPVLKDVGGQVPTESFVLGNSKLGYAKLGSKIPTETSIWDISRLDESKWGRHNSVYETIKNKLDKRNKGKSNNLQDALIAETAMLNRFVLVTHDGDLFSVVSELQGRAANLPMIRVIVSDLKKIFG